MESRLRFTPLPVLIYIEPRKLAPLKIRTLSNPLKNPSIPLKKPPKSMKHPSNP